MAEKILIINPFGVGDVLFSTPLISILKKAFSCPYIGYICNMRTREIIETNPDIDEVFVFDRGQHRELWKKSKFDAAGKFVNLWLAIKKRRFNIVIDLSLGKEYAFLCWLIGIKDRRGFNYRGRGRFLSRKIPFDGFNDLPVSEYYRMTIEDKVTNALGKTVLVTKTEDYSYIDNFLKGSGIKDEDILLGVAPGGGVSFGSKNQDRRRWPAKKFSELADRAVERFGCKVVLIWGPGEKTLVDAIKSRMKHRPLIAPETTIRQMAALCKICRVVVCSEGGPLHVASSQGVNTVSIFGPVDEKVYGPYPPGENNIVITSNADCRPCYRRFKLPECDNRKCLENISVDQVLGSLRLPKIT